jgi:hypothetical protein
MEIKLKNVMCRSFRLLIRDEFRSELFKRALEKEGSIIALAKKLKCDRNSIRNMKIGIRKFIKWQILQKLLEIAEIQIEEAEPHILAVKGGSSGKITKVKFPIRESPNWHYLLLKVWEMEPLKRISLDLLFGITKKN